MNKTKKLFVVAGLSIALSGAGAGSALAYGGHGGDRSGAHGHQYHGKHQNRGHHQGERGHHGHKQSHHRDSRRVAPQHNLTGCFTSGAADARGVAAGSPGFLSGNLIQIPVNAPMNVCGNTFGLGLGT